MVCTRPACHVPEVRVVGFTSGLSCLCAVTPGPTHCWTTGSMPQQNGIAVALYKCVRCVHFICVTIVCRRCRPKRKADDLQPDADDGDDDLVDVEGGQGVLPAATDEEFNDYSQPYAGLLSTQGFVGANNSNTGSSSVDSSRMVAGSAVSLRNEGFNSAGGRPLPVGIPTFPTQAGPAEVKDGLPVGVVADRFSHAGSPPAAVLREVGISSEDEEEDEDEEADSDDDDDESVPNLLNAPVPQFQAPAISLSKMTPRVIDQSSASSHQMSSLNVGANRQLERRQKREALLQQLQVRAVIGVESCCYVSTVSRCFLASILISNVCVHDRNRRRRLLWPHLPTSFPTWEWRRQPVL